MDPSSISSPAPPPNTVPFAVEPNNHPPPPLPQPLPSPSSNHPPYAEMIYTAIEALKEKEGSSKRAISKYIEQVYKDQLPNSESHQSLLTHHLKRLKSEGLLQMIKNSYIIPRSGPLPPSPPPTASPSPSSRPRGRPRKAQAQAQTPQAQDNVINPPPQPFPVVVVSSNNNNISPVAAAQTQAQQNASAEPVWAALGLTDEPAAVVTEGSKRRPGRPKKGLGSSPSPSQGGIQQLSPTPSRGRGRPPGSKSKSKKRPGRPPKIQPETPGLGSASAGVVGDVSGGSKRRPGRPAKNQQQNPTVIPFAAPVPEVVVPIAEGGVAVLTPRSRGRPRKNANAVAAVPVAVVAAAGRGRGRGRGRGGVAGRGRGGGRGRGRPRINLLARPAGRPVGRPKKRKKRKMSLRTRENKHVWTQELDEAMVKIFLELNMDKKKNAVWENIDMWKTATNKLNTSINLLSYAPMEVDDLGRRLNELNNKNKSAPKSSIQELVTHLFYHMEFSVPRFLLSRSPMQTTSPTTSQTTTGPFDMGGPSTPISESVNDVSDPLAEFMQNLCRMPVDRDMLFELVEKTPPQQKKIFNQCPPALKNDYLEKLKRDLGKR